MNKYRIIAHYESEEFPGPVVDAESESDAIEIAQDIWEITNNTEFYNDPDRFSAKKI